MLTTVIEQTTLIVSRLQQRLSLDSPSETHLLYRPDESYYYPQPKSATWLRCEKHCWGSWFDSKATVRIVHWSTWGRPVMQWRGFLNPANQWRHIRDVRKTSYPDSLSGPRGRLRCRYSGVSPIRFKSSIPSYPWLILLSLVTSWRDWNSIFVIILFIIIPSHYLVCSYN